MVLKKVAITGVSGMLGQHLLEVIQRENSWKVLGSSRSRPNHQPPCLESWNSWDLSDDINLESIFPGVDAVIHLGAVVPSSVIQPTEIEFDLANVVATVKIATWAAQKGIPMVFVSGAIVYKDADNSPHQALNESSPLLEKAGFGGIYGLSKRKAEDAILPMAVKGELNLTILRPSSIYGLGLPKEKWLATTLKKAELGQEILLSPPFDDKIGLVHASDVARACLLALIPSDSSRKSSIFNICSSHMSSIREIAEECVNVVEKGSIKLDQQKQMIAPKWRFHLSIDAAKNILGFHPKVSLFEGLRLMHLGKFL